MSSESFSRSSSIGRRALSKRARSPRSERPDLEKEPHLEFQGKTLEEAVERALTQLGRQPGEIEYEVIEDARRGFFGLGARLVKIRVLNASDEAPAHLLPGSSSAGKPQPPSSTPRKGRPRSAPPKGASTFPAKGSGSGRGPGSGRPPRSRSQEDGGAGPRSTGNQQGRRNARGDHGGRPSGTRGDDPSMGSRRRGATFGNQRNDAFGNQRNDGIGSRRDDSVGNRRDDAPSGYRRGDASLRRRPPEETSKEPTIPPAEAARAARLPDDAVYSKQEAVRAAASPLLRAMNLQLRAKLRDRDGAVILDLSGEDASRLLENEGEGLDALQHILNKILARDERFSTRLVVDCEGFRVHHDQEIVDRATRAAQEAFDTGRAVHLEDLNAYERRLIHVTLAEDTRVRTYSIGDGAIKRLTVEPLDQAPSEA